MLAIAGIFYGIINKGNNLKKIIFCGEKMELQTKKFAVLIDADNSSLQAIPSVLERSQNTE